MDAVTADRRDAIVRGLAHELIAYSPEELLRLAERELSWCQDEMRKAADKDQDAQRVNEARAQLRREALQRSIDAASRSSKPPSVF